MVRADSFIRDRRDGDHFGPYRVVEKIASGGMAEIYQVYAEGHPDHLFALKRIRPDCDDDVQFRKMLMDEAKIASQLHHKNIARVHGIVQDGDLLALLLDYVDGLDLGRLKKHLRDRNTTFSLQLAVHIVKQVLDGLDYAHDAKDSEGDYLQLVHRDVSPGNVMINAAGSVQIVDFGIARAQNRLAQTEAGNVKGKFRYMSPEQIKGCDTGPATDIYSTAVVLWELLAGRRIYDDVSVAQLMIKVANAEVPSLHDARAGLPRSLHRVFNRATALKAEDRYASARAFANALDDVLHEYDAMRCEYQLRDLIREARKKDSKARFSRAVARARVAAENDLEDAILNALETPDRVERVDTTGIESAEPPTGPISVEMLEARVDSQPPVR